MTREQQKQRLKVTKIAKKAKQKPKAQKKLQIEQT
jgi:hypothetical protein